MRRRANILATLSAPIWVPFFLAWLTAQIAVDAVGDVLRAARTRLPPKARP